MHVVYTAVIFYCFSADSVKVPVWAKPKMEKPPAGLHSEVFDWVKPQAEHRKSLLGQKLMGE